MTVKRSQFHQPSPTERIAKGILTVLLPVLLLAFSASSKAQQQFLRNINAEQSYDYLYAGFVQSSLTNVEGETLSGFGIELAGSKSFGDNFHVWGNGGRASVEFAEFDDVSLSFGTTAFNIGVGAQVDASEYVSFFARAGIMFLMETFDSAGIPFFPREFRGGSIASIGVITFPTPKFGLSGSVERIEGGSANFERLEVDDESEFFLLGVSAQYRPTDEFTARAFVQRGISDDASDYNVLGAIAEYRFTNIVAAYASVTGLSPDDDEVDVRAFGAGLRFHLP